MTLTDLTALFSEILEVDDVDAEDNFFDVGGNSILALTLISEVSSRWGVKISLIDLVRNPSPEGVMRVLTGSSSSHRNNPAGYNEGPEPGR